MWADHGELRKSGRGFSCATCPERVQKLRRCKEERMDFDEADGSMWPMYVEKGGAMYGFCPAKATWDSEATSVFRMLIISAETGTMLEVGGIYDQPDWWVELVSEFIPRYNQNKLVSIAKAFIGKGK